MPDRLKVGVYGITGCAGCQLSVAFNEDQLLSLFELLDVQAFPFVTSANKEEGFDLVLMEGLVASPRDLELLKDVRSKTSILVALGACAATGCIPAYRKYTLPAEYQHLFYTKAEDIKDVDPTPIDAHVKVDYTIPGCPPSEWEILSFVKTLLLGKEWRPYRSPVCVACRRNGNFCLLDLGKPCLGPITCGGCNAVCVNGGFECWGCRGQTDDANHKAYIELLEGKGFSREFILQRMRSFVGLKITEPELV